MRRGTHRNCKSGEQATIAGIQRSRQAGAPTVAQNPLPSRICRIREFVVSRWLDPGSGTPTAQGDSE